jgi:hypothetical protein
MTSLRELYELPEGGITWLRSYLEQRRPRSVLEVGPGVSTHIMREFGCQVVSLENDPAFMRPEHVAYTNTEGLGLLPGACPALGDRLERQFDFGFVDGPRGVRRLSRQYTCKFVADRCATWALHDACRPGELETIELLRVRGWRVTVLTRPDPRGIALFERVL